MMNKKRRLGRGLEALLSQTGEPTTSAAESMDASAETPRIIPMRTQELDASPAIATVPPSARPAAQGSLTAASTASPAKTGSLLTLNVHEIEDNPFQPRRDFSEPEIVSLAESLKEHDMLQPILVRRVGQRYQLISGERRLRAAIRAGWKTIPAQLREANDRLVAELAIVENLQRKDLNAIEKALSFRRYLDEHSCPQEELAGRLKIDRSTIANLIRLLELPEIVQQTVRTSVISAGHARALLTLGDERLQIEFCNRIQAEGWSVRETERQVQDKVRELEGESPASAGDDAAKKKQRTQSHQLASLEQEFRMALGTKVEIRKSARGKGKITIQFNSVDEFERLRRTLCESVLQQRAAG